MQVRLTAVGGEGFTKTVSLRTGQLTPCEKYSSVYFTTDQKHVSSNFLIWRQVIATIIMPDKNVHISIILGTSAQISMSPYEHAAGSATTISIPLDRSPLVFASKPVTL
jgi:hypothetical protein